jgi:hypothetical protein
MASTRPSPTPGGKTRVALAWLALLVAAAVLLWPALRPVHVEGFSASIVALGLHMAQGTIHDFMPFAPFNLDYYGLTKLGALYGVAVLSPLLGGDGAFRLEMWIGAALTLAASADLIRRWSGASWLVACATLLLMPGVAESFFFFNDNVPSTGLMLAALALWARRPTVPVALLAGVLIGYAVAIRTDTVLVTATAMPLVALESRKPAQAALFTAVAGATAILTLLLLFGLVHATPLDALRAGQIAIGLWNRSSEVGRHLAVIVYFVGPPALVLAVFGVVSQVGERRWLRLALTVGVPAAVNLALLGKMWEMRQLLVLTPFIGALVASGADVLIANLRRGQPIWPLLVGVLILGWLASPAEGVALSDGPRALTGRIAGLHLWYAWQQSVRDDFGRIDAAIASGPANGSLAVLTDGWNDDRYLHLLLVEQGFRRAPLPPPCSVIGEAMSANGRTVIALSIRQSFFAGFPALDAQRLERYATPCLASLRPDRTILLADSTRLDGAFGRDDRLQGLDPALVTLTVKRILAVPMDARKLTLLDQFYRKEAIQFGPPLSAESAMAATQSRTPFSR